MLRRVRRLGFRCFRSLSLSVAVQSPHHQELDLLTIIAAFTVDNTLLQPQLHRTMVVSFAEQHCTRLGAYATMPPSHHGSTTSYRSHNSAMLHQWSQPRQRFIRKAIDATRRHTVYAFVAAPAEGVRYVVTDDASPAEQSIQRHVAYCIRSLLLTTPHVSS